MSTTSTREALGVVKDPVCGMSVPDDAPLHAKQDGMEYRFCSQTCLREFTQPAREARRTLLLAALSILLGSLTAFFEYFYPVRGLSITNEMLLFLLATPVQFGAGWLFYRGALDAFRARRANMDLLIAIGTSAAWLYSTLYTFQGILWPTFLPSLGMGTQVFFTESGLIIGFILAGKYAEHLVKGRATRAITKLMDLQPKQAHVLRGKREALVPVEELRVGDVVIIKPGERIPCDGLVVEGSSSVDQSIVTGESIPVSKKKGDEVIGASINKTGLLRVRVTRVGEETVLSQIVRMVREAIGVRAPMQRLADTVSAYFVPVVVAAAIGAFLFWNYATAAGFPVAFTTFISVLIIACPCALGIATPAAIMVGASKGAQNGILFKNGEVLERARSLDSIIFDKTGTLTMGEPKVTDLVALAGNQERVLQLAASLENGSEHAIAAAVVERAKQDRLSISKVTGFKAVSGKGVIGKVGTKQVAVGNRALLKQLRVTVPEERLSRLEQEGKTTVVVVEGARAIGLVAVADTIRPEAPAAVRSLERMGKAVWMITGDNEVTARAIARQAGISEARVLANVLPSDKAAKVKELQSRGLRVGMVGDGINDAPALAQADVGIAIGAGTDIAKETGGIVLMRDDLRAVPAAIELSSKTVGKMRQNLFWAFAYNVVLIPVAAGALYPAGILLNPIFAAIAMALSSVTVVSNSLLLELYKPRH